MSSIIRYPAAERNKEPILQTLRLIFQQLAAPTTVAPYQSLIPITVRKVLEIGSATGQHVAYFAASLPHIHFQPSDVDQKLFPSINAFKTEYKLNNISSPLVLDLTKPIHEWPVQRSDDTHNNYDAIQAIYCSNVIHITPYECTIGLFTGAGMLLPPAGVLLLYGPFACDGILEPESNRSFHASLRAQNRDWGVRDIRQQLIPLAMKNGLTLQCQFDMPSNNKVLLFQKH